MPLSLTEPGDLLLDGIKHQRADKRHVPTLRALRIRTSAAADCGNLRIEGGITQDARAAPYDSRGLLLHEHRVDQLPRAVRVERLA